MSRTDRDHDAAVAVADRVVVLAVVATAVVVGALLLVGVAVAARVLLIVLGSFVVVQLGYRAARTWHRWRQR